jgi:hypothetical protein
MIDDLTHDLPKLLAASGQAGHRIEDLEMRRPGLGQVFLRLTGRDLRE